MKCARWVAADVSISTVGLGGFELGPEDGDRRTSTGLYAYRDRDRCRESIG